MRKIILVILLGIMPVKSFSEEPLQPPLMKYESCNETGTICTQSKIEHYVEGNQNVSVAEVTSQSNHDLLLNLDHFYRNECSAMLGIPLNKSVPKDKFKPWGECIVKKLRNAIVSKNQENLDYLEKTKKIFANK